jgi:NodT family efflux transporter outer membrane factor (OMF) lipoprotein
MASPSRIPRLAASVLLVVGSACSLAPEARVPEPVAEVPDAFQEADTAAGPMGARAYEPRSWWRAFDDPVLDRLLDSALVANLELAEAVGRVQEARAAAGVARADLFPSVQANVEASRSDNPGNAGFGRIFQILRGAGQDTTGTPPDTADGGGDEETRRIVNENYTVSLGLSYEVDFWGRARNDLGAAVRELEAGVDDLHAARLGVLAESITAYFQVVDLRSRVALTAEVVDVLTERVALTETRYERGVATSLELYQIRQELRDAQAGLPQLRSQLVDAEGRLAVLVGRFPSDLRRWLPVELTPTLPRTPVPTGIPADLLWQRPDVRAAARRLDAARLRVGARKAELFPRLTLNATVGLEGAEPDAVTELDQWFTNLVGGLTAPLFQGGRLRANLNAQEARYGQRAAAYARTLLTAVQEAEAALRDHQEERERYAFLESQLEEASASLDLQARRYASGVADYTDYLDALRARLTVESGLAGAGRDLALARLGVHRALGGGWAGDLERPDDLPYLTDATEPPAPATSGPSREDP